jgi:hypothetical protein
MNQHEEVEEFDTASVCSVLKYRINVFGYSVNLWALLLVIAVIVAVYNYRSSIPSFNIGGSDFLLSSTSSMRELAHQMGGFTIDTPTFIRNMN